MLKGVLKKVGLNKKEIHVYLALLELGSQPASVIGKKAKINRSTTYLILETLIKQGFVNQHIRADVKYFTASDPQVITQSLERHEKQLTETRKEIVELLPEFYALTNPLSIKPAAFHNELFGLRYFGDLERAKSLEKPLICDY